MKNPYLSLMKTAWHYARKEKKQYVLIYSLFILASATFALFPVVYGKFINAIQQEGLQHLHYAWIYAGVYLLLKIIQWSFHGPARIQPLIFSGQVDLKNFQQPSNEKPIWCPNLNDE